MKILSEEEFWAFNEKHPGRFPDVDYAVNKNYTSAPSRRRRYFQYIERMKDKEARIQEKMAAKPDPQAVSFREEILKRDGYQCQLWKKLDIEEKKNLCLNSSGFEKVLDVAHIKSRGTTPESKWDRNNVILLNRYSHSMLDQGKHPLNGKMISPTEKKAWWSRILEGSAIMAVETDGAKETKAGSVD